MILSKKKTNEGEEQKIQIFIPPEYRKINLKKESIENKNLEDYNLQIQLREYVPKNIQLPTIPEEELFIHLHKSNLKGNEIIGDLTPILYKGYSVYFHYTEDTFDEKYKVNNSIFFLDDLAPSKLKNKYYGLQLFFEFSYINEKFKKGKYFKRNSLNFAEYLENYAFLRGKYLGNFYISPKEYLKIQIVEKFGLEETQKKLTEAANSPFSFYGILFSLLNNEISSFYNPFPSSDELSNEKEAELLLKLIKKCASNSNVKKNT